VLDAALRMFAERGYHGTAVPELAGAAGVGTGTLYRYFATKEVLVNEVYRDAKARLRSALLDGLDLTSPGDAWFTDVWDRLARFARAEPDAFRFLEMQDHAAYLDDESRRVEMSVLAPLWLAGQRLRENQPDAPLPVDVAIALVWGAFVGLVKAERLGYLRLDEATLTLAGKTCWEIVAPPDGAPAKAATAKTAAAKTATAKTATAKTATAKTATAKTAAAKTATAKAENARAAAVTTPTDTATHQRRKRRN
jgi:AcrR family transcriptional regulator